MTNFMRRKTFDKNDKMLEIRLTKKHLIILIRKTFSKIDKEYI